MGVVIERFDVYVVELDPTVGSEIQKLRPCVVISPDDINDYLKTVIVAPMTTQRKNYPYRIPCLFQGKPGSIALDQIRTVDKSRLKKRLSKIDSVTQKSVLNGLASMFAE